MLFETLQKEMTQALKDGNKFRRTTLSTLIAGIKKVAIDLGTRDNITDELVEHSLRRERKKLMEVINQYGAEMPADKFTEYHQQVLIIDEFVRPMVEDENTIEDVIRAVAWEEKMDITKANQGKFMKILKSDYLLDMKIASNVYKRIAE